MVNSFGGMLQVLIVQIGQDTLSKLSDMCTAIFNTLTSISSRDSCRLAALFVMNGLLHTLQRDQIKGISENVRSVIQSTLDEPFSNFEKRVAVGLIQDLSTNMDSKTMNGHLDDYVKMLIAVLRE